MVLKLIKGLTPKFNEVATYLKQFDPIPSFYETRCNHQASREASVEAMTLVSTQNSNNDGFLSSSRGLQQQSHRGGRRQGSRRGKGKMEDNGGHLIPVTQRVLFLGLLLGIHATM